MANDKHVALLRQGVAAWNAWRDENPEIRPDLSKADLREANVMGAKLHEADLTMANLSKVNLSWADLRSADLREADLEDANLELTDLSRADLTRARLEGVILAAADLRRANISDAKLRRANLTMAKLSEADLSGADLGGADLGGANLSGADLRSANLSEADLGAANLSGADLRSADLQKAGISEANLTGANLSEADLRSASLLQTDLTDADLTDCRIYGVSAWGLRLHGAKQQNLVITDFLEPEITVDNIEVAQFIYLMLNNEKVRDVIDNITSKVVLILGRFTGERKAVLDAIREELRQRNYLPILFDFNVPAMRDITETISLLARMARFIIADLTDASSIPKELEAIVPGLAVPVQPLLAGSSRPYAMFKDYWKYEWVLPAYRYEGLEPLLAALAEKVIAPAEDKAKALAERRRMFEAELTKAQ